MAEILAYFAESLETAEVAPEPADQNGRALFERLQILEHAEQLSRRVLDLKKNIQGAKAELKVREPVFPLCACVCLLVFVSACVFLGVLLRVCCSW